MVDRWELKKIESDVLVKKYELLRSEVRLNVVRYSDLMRRVQIIVWSVFAASAYIYSGDHVSRLYPSLENWGMWVVFATLMILTYLYYFSCIMDTLYCVYLLAARMAVIEDKLNSIVESRVLGWESRYCPPFWGAFFPFPGVVNPSAFVTLSGLAVYLIGICLIPFYMFLVLSEQVLHVTVMQYVAAVSEYIACLMSERIYSGVPVNIGCVFIIPVLSLSAFISSVFMGVAVVLRGRAPIFAAMRKLNAEDQTGEALAMEGIAGRA